MDDQAHIPLNQDDDPPCKLDLGYFTQPQFCPKMVRHKSRRCFELFLYLAKAFMNAFGQPISPTSIELCHACGIDPAKRHSRTILSRLLRSLRTDFRVIDFQPIKRRRPQIRLLPAMPAANLLNPQHYIYFAEGWSSNDRALFGTLGKRAFAAEYMYLIARYESALARSKHGRSYWYYPLDRISATYHVSTRFAGVGLRALVELGAMHIAHGQYRIIAPNDEFGRANRYYFEGLSAVFQRQQEYGLLGEVNGPAFEVAKTLSAELANGATIKNVEGLCLLLATVGELEVRNVIQQISSLPKRSLKRRLAYVRAHCSKCSTVGSTPRTN